MWKPGDTYYGEFVVWVPASNTAINADSLPTVKISHNGVYDNTVTVTVTNKGTGQYTFHAVIPSTYAIGDEVAFTSFYAVASVAMVQIEDQFQLDNTRDLLSALVNPIPANTVTYFGYSQLGDGTPVEGRQVTVKLVGGPQASGLAMIEAAFPPIYTDAAGRWQVSLARGKQFEIRIPEENIDSTVTVSTDLTVVSVNIKDAL